VCDTSYTDYIYNWCGIRGRLQNLGEDSFKISLYRVAITWQQRFKVTAVGVLLHVTVERRHLWQVMQRDSDC